MKMLPAILENTTLYQELQAETLDLRDNRGKKHDMGFVLFGFISALLCNRDGTLSSIHRYIVNKNREFCQVLEIPYRNPISRAQIAILLTKVNQTVLNQIFAKYFAHKPSMPSIRHWFSVDGKEQKGTIQAGQSRGEATVTIVGQQSGKILGQGFFNGIKDSEIQCVQQVLADANLSGVGFSLDALHCNADTLSAIIRASNHYIVGLKSNQPTLENLVLDEVLLGEPYAEQTTFDNKHGRQEVRHYEAYDISELDFADRWQFCCLSSVIRVHRTRTIVKTNQISEQVSYYVSSISYQNIAEQYELFDAIRNHWAIECSHWILDNTFKEDAFVTTSAAISKSTSSCRRFCLNILKSINPKSIIAQMQRFGDDFDVLCHYLKKHHFL